MQWVFLTCVLAVLCRCDGGAIRCSSENPDGPCLNEKEKNVPLPPVEITEEKEVSVQVECLAGTEWYSNCYYCVCSDSGLAECLTQAFCEDEVSSEPLHCKPNTTFVRGCNTCVCLENGLALCTAQDCRGSGIREMTELPVGKQCSPGSTWKSSCSECSCSETGYSVCIPTTCENSEKDLDIEKDAEKIDEAKDLTGPTNGGSSNADNNKKDLAEITHNLVKRAACKPNEEFQNECNSCKCSGDGLHYTCTQNECLERDMTKEVEVFMESEGVDHIERHSVCKPSDTFYIGCNTCHCNDDGTDYTCTNKPCPLPEDVELFHELKITKSSTNSTKEVICVANRMFIKDCNTCWCNDDGTSYFCTRKVCIPEFPDDIKVDEDKPEALRTIKKECRPDEVFELDCNMCRCNPDGKSFSCTRRACVEQEDIKNSSVVRRVRATQQEAPKACQPGQEFRLDCNKCLCDNKGQDFSCTRIDCNALNNNNNGGGRSKREVSDVAEIASACVPGSVFQQDCNTCRCTTDGLHGMCSTKRCEEPKTNQLNNEEHSPESDPGFRCNPGEQFKRSCNDCTCSADGKSYFCTLRLCDLFLSTAV